MITRPCLAYVSLAFLRRRRASILRPPTSLPNAAHFSSFRSRSILRAPTSSACHASSTLTSPRRLRQASCPASVYLMMYVLLDYVLNSTNGQMMPTFPEDSLNGPIVKATLVGLYNPSAQGRRKLSFVWPRITGGLRPLRVSWCLGWISNRSRHGSQVTIMVIM